jgi:hypothetical protein
MPATERKIVSSPFGTIKLSVILVMALFLGFFFVGGVEASTIFFDDFENYNLGDLAGQGNWFPYMGRISSSTDIVNNSRYSALQSILINHYDFVEKEGIHLASSTISFWFKDGEVREFDGQPYVDFYLSQATSSDGGGGLDVGVRVRCKGIDPDYCKENGFAVEYFKLGGGTEQYATSTPNTWNNIQINWVEGATDYARYKLNDNNWTDFLQPYDSFSYIAFFGIDAVNSSADMDLWIDLISGGPTEGYIIPELGLPELPALEECSGYSITERILCEIKNFFNRLFVPSPDKITELKATLELAKTKFPYNYALAIKDFFIYLKDNISESEAISFSILGKAGEVNMDFWNSETNLAGVSQSFLNIFRTFLKFLVILIFGLWCFSFIKRIFK